MKRGILIGLLIMVFLATACEKANPKKEEEKLSSMDYITIQNEQFKLVHSTNLHDMQYHVNDDDFHTEATENTRVMNYTLQERLVFEVRIMSDENRSLSELKSILRTQSNAKESVKEVNGISYEYYEYLAEGTPIHHYLYEYKGRTYSIGFFLGKDSGNIEEVFMNHVSFQ